MAQHPPPEDALRSALHDGLRSSDGTELDLPETTRAALLRVLDALESGPDVLIFPADAYLSTGQAAEVLGINRITVARLVDRGELASHGSGSHRRIAATEVARYREERARRRRAAGRELAADLTADLPADRTVRTR